MKKKYFITEKPCEACGKTIVKRADERPANFNRRKCCYEGDCATVLREKNRLNTIRTQIYYEPFSNKLAQQFIRGNV